MGLSTAGYAALLRLGGFEVRVRPPLAPAQFGPPTPPLWQWRPPRVRNSGPPNPAPAPTSSVFAALSEWAAG